MLHRMVLASVNWERSTVGARHMWLQHWQEYVTLKHVGTAACLPAGLNRNSPAPTADSPAAGGPRGEVQDRGGPSQSQEREYPSQVRGHPSQNREHPFQTREHPSQNRQHPSQEGGFPAQHRGMSTQDRRGPSLSHATAADRPNALQLLSGLGGYNNRQGLSTRPRSPSLGQEASLGAHVPGHAEEDAHQVDHWHL